MSGLITTKNLSVIGPLTDSTSSIGAPSQVLASTGTGTQWIPATNFIMFNSKGNIQNEAYLIFGGRITYNISDAQFMVPRACTLTSLSCLFNFAPGENATWTITVIKNGASTSLSLNISGSNKEGIILYNLSCNQYDQLAVHITNSGFPSHPTANVSIEYY